MIAGAAVRWASKIARVAIPNKEIVHRISFVGAKGDHPSNAERDMRVIIRHREEALHQL